MAEFRPHIVKGKFQSNKYPWCKPGFVPLKLTDPMARYVLRVYANFRRVKDPQFSVDLVWAIEKEERKR